VDVRDLAFRSVSLRSSSLRIFIRDIRRWSSECGFSSRMPDQSPDFGRVLLLSGDVDRGVRVPLRSLAVLNLAEGGFTNVT
jgi:hypothetical protein